MLNLATFEERMNWIVNEAPGMHVCMYVCRCVCMYVIVYVCVHVYTYAYLCVCMHICVYVCVCPRLRSISTEYTYTQAAKEAKAEKKRARSHQSSQSIRCSLKLANFGACFFQKTLVPHLSIPLTLARKKSNSSTSNRISAARLPPDKVVRQQNQVCPSLLAHEPCRPPDFAGVAASSLTLVGAAGWPRTATDEPAAGGPWPGRSLPPRKGKIGAVSRSVCVSDPAAPHCAPTGS
jgi:hypothetical protein